MAENTKPRVKVPASVKKGEPFEIKTTISHTMESGQRKDKDGKPIARQIINKFVVSFNGKEVMSSEWYPSISANPYCEFYAAVEENGTMEFAWHDDDGSVYKTTAEIKVG